MISKTANCLAFFATEEIFETRHFNVGLLGLPGPANPTQYLGDAKVVRFCGGWALRWLRPAAEPSSGKRVTVGPLTGTAASRGVESNRLAVSCSRV